MCVELQAQKGMLDIKNLADVFLYIRKTLPIALSFPVSIL